MRVEGRHDEEEDKEGSENGRDVDRMRIDQVGTHHGLACSVCATSLVHRLRQTKIS